MTGLRNLRIFFRYNRVFVSSDNIWRFKLSTTRLIDSTKTKRCYECCVMYLLRMKACIQRPLYTFTARSVSQFDVTVQFAHNIRLDMVEETYLQSRHSKSSLFCRRVDKCHLLIVQQLKSILVAVPFPCFTCQNALSVSILIGVRTILRYVKSWFILLYENVFFADLNQTHYEEQEKFTLQHSISFIIAVWTFQLKFIHVSLIYR